MKTKVLLIGSNPSNKSPDLSAFHPSTRSRMIIDQWLYKYDVDIACINIMDKTTPNNGPLRVRAIRESIPSLIEKLDKHKDYKFIAFGGTAQKAMNLTGRVFLPAPHPSGCNRNLNDSAYVATWLHALEDFLKPVELCRRCRTPIHKEELKPSA